MPSHFTPQIASAWDRACRSFLVFAIEVTTGTSGEKKIRNRHSSPEVRVALYCSFNFQDRFHVAFESYPLLVAFRDLVYRPQMDEARKLVLEEDM